MLAEALLLIGSVVGLASVIAIGQRKARTNRAWQAWLAEHPTFLFPVEAAGDLATKLGLGTAIAVYQTNTTGEAEFMAVARTLSSRGYDVFLANGRERLNAILDALPRGINRLVLTGHGAQDYFFTQWPSSAGRSITPEVLASALVGKLAPGATVVLAGCNAGANPEDSVTHPPAPDGGERSFAGRLRDMLVQANSGSGGVVKAHSTRGHATQNPNIRLFPIAIGAVGAPGVAVGGLAYGPEAERRLLGLAGLGGLGDAPPGQSQGSWAVPVGIGLMLGAVAAVALGVGRSQQDED
jgi:hypothetical protein